MTFPGLVKLGIVQTLPLPSTIAAVADGIVVPLGDGFGTPLASWGQPEPVNWYQMLPAFAA